METGRVGGPGETPPRGTKWADGGSFVALTLSGISLASWPAAPARVRDRVAQLVGSLRRLRAIGLEGAHRPRTQYLGVVLVTPDPIRQPEPQRSMQHKTDDEDGPVNPQRTGWRCLGQHHPTGEWWRRNPR